MKAGQELDALVAEKVIGWQWNVDRSAFFPPGLHPMSNIFGHKVPQYSENIAEAWLVVEKLVKSGFHFLLLKSADSGRSIATFYLGPEDRSDTSKSADEAPHAICLAALEALRYEVPA